MTLRPDTHPLAAAGIVCFHASAVAHDGLAEVFVGEKGAGKSTAAARRIAQGASLVSDDLVPMFVTDNVVVAVATADHLRLVVDPQGNKEPVPVPIPVEGGRPLYPGHAELLQLHLHHPFRPYVWPVRSIRLLGQTPPWPNALTLASHAYGDEPLSNEFQRQRLDLACRLQPLMA